ncbi:BspA family leucine-rich repeat surface protein [Bifidobacterium sp. ESL0763]|uniref:BspA family leucine-rich repeat surface protein n=1 Tax=Bifidobacterium sp. ESL0763 TaxID=2983227 RepID=UPI0023F6A26A|nr:BspA family leucine-rich repeat surface protein [Bifidobacterium sp. ESL0763]MDF7663272.1 BspA family leucine-rich repeat surface protein [Bifidobacterium sp. ESL0763]
MKKGSFKALGVAVAAAMLLGTVTVSATANESVGDAEGSNVATQALQPGTRQTKDAQPQGQAPQLPDANAPADPANPANPSTPAQTPSADGSTSQNEAQQNGSSEPGKANGSNADGSKTGKADGADSSAKSGADTSNQQVGTQGDEWAPACPTSYPAKWGDADWFLTRDGDTLVFTVHAGHVGDDLHAPWHCGNSPYPLVNTYKLRIVFTDPTHTVLPEDSSLLFANERGLSSIEGVGDLDVSHVKNMHYMFGDDPNLDDLSTLSHWGRNTHNVTDMSEMFKSDVYHSPSEGYLGIKKIGVSGWDTSNVTTMKEMFQYDERVETLDVGTRQATDSKGTYTAWDVSKVTNMSYMFNDCVQLVNPDVSHWNTHNVTTMESLFSGMGGDSPMKGITNVDVSKWVTSNVTNMSGLFFASYIDHPAVDKWDTSKVTDIGGIFGFDTKLTSIGTVKCSDAKANGLKACPSHAKLKDVVGANDVPDTVGVSDWDTSKMTSFTEAFYICPKLKSVDLTNWDTSSDLTMTFMFANDYSYPGNGNGPSALTYVGDLSGWDTSKVRDMECTFRYNENLKTIGDLSNWQTGDVTDMSSMFEDTGIESLGGEDPEHPEAPPAGLKNWDTSKVTSMAWMFGQATALKGLDLSKWNTSAIRMDDDGNCTPNGLHSCWNQSGITDMFYKTTNLKSVGNLSHWDVSHVKQLSSLFRESGVESLDLSGWDVSNAEEANYTFALTPNLQNLKLDGWDMRKVTSMRQLFSYTGYQIGVLLDLTDWKVNPNPTDSKFIFYGDSLLSLDLSGWDTDTIGSFELYFPKSLQRLTLGPKTKLRNSFFTGDAANLGIRTGDPYNFQEHDANGNLTTDWTTIYSGEWAEATNRTSGFTAPSCSVGGARRGEEWNSCDSHAGGSATSSLVDRNATTPHAGTYVWETKATVHFSGLNHTDAADAAAEDGQKGPETAYGVHGVGKLDGAAEPEDFDSLAIKAPAKLAAQDHHTFTGWKLDGKKDGKGNPTSVVDEGDFVYVRPGDTQVDPTDPTGQRRVDTNILRGQWQEANKTSFYTLHFDSNIHDSGATVDGTVADWTSEPSWTDSGYAQPTLPQNGFTVTSDDNVYTFKGWSPTRDGSSAVYPAGSTGYMMVGLLGQHEATMYAQWEKTPKVNYQLQFEANTGSAATDGDVTGLPDSQSQKTADNSHKFTFAGADPVRGSHDNNYTWEFTGWSTVAGNTGGTSLTKNHAGGYDYTVEKENPSVKLYAHWQKSYTYELSFDPNVQDGSATGHYTDTVSAHSTNHAQTIVLNGNESYERPGYEFTGWSEDSHDVNNPHYRPGVRYNIGFCGTGTANPSCPATADGTTARVHVVLYAQWKQNPVPSTPTPPTPTPPAPAPPAPTPPAPAAPRLPVPAPAVTPAAPALPQAQSDQPKSQPERRKGSSSDGSASSPAPSASGRDWRCNPITGEVTPRDGSGSGSAYVTRGSGFVAIEDASAVSASQSCASMAARMLRFVKMQADFPWWIVLALAVLLMLMFVRSRERFVYAQHRAPEVDD